MKTYLNAISRQIHGFNERVFGIKITRLGHNSDFFTPMSASIAKRIQ